MNVAPQPSVAFDFEVEQEHILRAGRAVELKDLARQEATTTFFIQVQLLEITIHVL